MINKIKGFKIIICELKQIIPSLTYKSCPIVNRTVEYRCLKFMYCYRHRKMYLEASKIEVKCSYGFG